MNQFPKLSHIPVLLSPVLQILKQHHIKSVLDCTFGNGGYTREFLKLYDTTSIDRDLSSCELGKSLGFKVEHLNFRHINRHYDAVVYDLGMCTNQLSNRGFSYRNSSELDMRMDTSQELSAYNVVNEYHVDKLARILIEGEEKMGYKIAKNIVASREKKPITTSGQLSDLILKVKNMQGFKGVKHPAAVAFQAIRMHVNDELASLWDSLVNCERYLEENALVIVVTFHSLEDRLVKHFFKSCIDGSREDRTPQEISKKDGARYHRQRVESVKALYDFERYGQEKELNTKRSGTFKQLGKVIKPSALEILENPRARSAKLRCYQRTAAPPIYS